MWRLDYHSKEVLTNTDLEWFLSNLLEKYLEDVGVHRKSIWFQLNNDFISGAIVICVGAYGIHFILTWSGMYATSTSLPA